MDKPQSIKERLYLVVKQMMKETSVLPPALTPVIDNLIKGYMSKASDTDIKNIVIQLRDVFIPWLLSDD